MTTITKCEYNVLSAILQFCEGQAQVFSAGDVAESPATLASLERKGILIKSSLRYIGSNEQLYTANCETAVSAYRAYLPVSYQVS